MSTIYHNIKHFGNVTEAFDDDVGLQERLQQTR